MSRTLKRPSAPQRMTQRRLWLQRRRLFVVAILAVPIAGFVTNALSHPTHPVVRRPAVEPSTYGYMPALLDAARKHHNPLLGLPHHNLFVVTENGHRTLMIAPRVAPALTKGAH